MSLTQCNLGTEKDPPFQLAGRLNDSDLRSGGPFYTTYVRAYGMANSTLILTVIFRKTSHKPAYF